MKTIKETNLYDNHGDFAAVSVSLDDTLAYIKQLHPELNASIHYEDNDDYGCEHYILIEGLCADIVLKKNYGGMYCQANYIDCTVSKKFFRNKQSGISHEFLFKEGKEPEPVAIGNNYSEKIASYLDSHLPYLEGNREIFYRKDYKWHNDLSGEHKLNTISYDVIIVSDEDFYTDKEQKTEYKSSVFEKEKKRETKEIDTEFGIIIVEKLNDVDDNPEAAFYEDKSMVPMFVAKPKGGEWYQYSQGSTEIEALNNLIESWFKS